MNAGVRYLLNKTSAEQIAGHLSRCDAEFVPPLSGRVAIEDYARKIASRATRFEAWSGSTLVGLLAVYCNDREEGIAYITSISVLRGWTGEGIAAHLMSQCVEHAKATGMRQISLEVARDNTPAIKLYEKSGFVVGSDKRPFITMGLRLKNGEGHEQQT